MPLIIRIDVDRPYGKHPVWRHVLSRAGSDLYFPRLQCLGYLDELAAILHLLNEHHARSHVFFRRCTLPSPRISGLLESGGHELGLHLEDSRSFESFAREKRWLERTTGRSIRTFSKHGSGRLKFGRRHFPPYEAEKYIAWGNRADMSAFLGNLEDPTLPPLRLGNLQVYPSAFWLEPSWRDVNRFHIGWLKRAASERNVVLLIHPENVLEDAGLTEEFTDLVSSVPTATL